MVLHLAQAQAEGRRGVLAASLDKLEGGFVLGGGFDETGGAHAVGLGDADVFEFDSGNEDAPGGRGWLAVVLEYFSWVV